MFAVRARRAAVALFCAMTAVPGAACFRSPAPPGWLSKPEDAQREAFGSWIRLEQRVATGRASMEGELIAVGADSVHILAGERLVSLPMASVCCVTLVAFHMDYAPLQWWAALGTLSTVSHGFGLILTAPIWLISGTAAAASASRAPAIRSADPAALRPFARFPQGIPPGLDRTTLRPKPFPVPRRVR